MSATCKILYWDSDYQVKGIAAAQSSRKGLEVLASARGELGSSFASQLHAVSKELKHTQADAFLLGGYLSEFICFELIMPKLNRAALKNALQFELERRIPALKEGMSTSFRVMPGPTDRQVKVRVFAVRSRVWDELLDRIKGSGIRFDAICHPLMAVELGDEKKCAEFPDISPGQSLVLGENGLAELLLASCDSGIPDTTPEILAAYALSPEFKPDRPYLGNLPEEFRVHRFKHRRNFSIFLGIVTACLCGILFYLNRSDRVEQVSLFQQAINKADARLRAQKVKNEKLRPISKFTEKMLETVQNEPILPIFDMLTEKLPNNVWVTSFRTGNTQFTVTLSVSGDSANLAAILANVDPWLVTSQNQQRQGDGTENWVVTLKRK